MLSGSFAYAFGSAGAVDLSKKKKSNKTELSGKCAGWSPCRLPAESHVLTHVLTYRPAPEITISRMVYIVCYGPDKIKSVNVLMETEQGFGSSFVSKLLPYFHNLSHTLLPWKSLAFCGYTLLALD